MLLNMCRLLRYSLLCSAIFLVSCSTVFSAESPDEYSDRLKAKVNPGSFGPARTVERQKRSDDETWTGRWMPDKPTERPTTDYLHVEYPLQEMTPEQQSMWTMVNSTCDDGKTNLTVDWPGSPVNYTCFNPKHRLVPDDSLQALIIKDNLPTAYRAKHICMNNEIYYDSYLPTFGPHRPAWPRYGEYKFLPRQRWIHSLEHGAVVMLYHPCAHPMLISKLRKIVNACLYRHIISPYTMLPHNRPLALVTWGWALLMADIDTEIVTKFITDHALNGPEHLSKNGQYDYMLIKPAKVISDIEDSALCNFH